MNQLFHSSLNLLKRPIVLKTYNSVFGVENATQITKYVYLGNIQSSQDEEFLKMNQIGAVLNVTEKENFHSYFTHKPKLRIDVKDSKEIENVRKFYRKIDEGVRFIEENVAKENKILVHCYWGFMRSATIVAAYLMKHYQFRPEEAIAYVREKRPKSLNSMYNFNDLLVEYYKEYIRN